MGFVDDVLDEFSGLLRYDEIVNMTYKQLGYLREHHAKHHPSEVKKVAQALMDSPK